MGKVMTKDIKILTAKISRLYSAELIDSYQKTLCLNLLGQGNVKRVKTGLSKFPD